MQFSTLKRRFQNDSDSRRKKENKDRTSEFIESFQS